MNEKPPRIKNLFLFDRDLNLIDSVNYPAPIESIFIEEEIPGRDRTFLILSSRDVTNVAIVGPITLTTDLGKIFYRLETRGEDITGGNLTIRENVNVNTTLGVTTKHATFAFDAQPKTTVEAAFNGFTKLTIEGPPIADDTIGILTNGIGTVHCVQSDLEPKWCLARMDIGFNILERVDLGHTARAIVKVGDSYYVITDPLQPEVQYNPIYGGQVSYLFLPQFIFYNPPIELSASNGNRYEELIGGQIVMTMGSQLSGLGGGLTHAPPIDIVGGDIDALQLNAIVAKMSIYTGQSLVVTQGSGFYIFANNPVAFGPTSIPGGGCFHRAQPRQDFVKVDKQSLAIQQVGEWDHDLFAAKVSDRKSLIYLSGNDEFVIATGSPVTNRISHTILNPSTGGFAGTSAFFGTLVGVPIGFPVNNFSAYTITFYSNATAISAEFPMSDYYDSVTGFAKRSAICVIYNTFFGAGSTVPDPTPDSQTILFSGPLALSTVPQPGYKIGPTGNIFNNPSRPEGSVHSYPLTQGGPAIAGVASFAQGFNISGRFDGTEMFRIRYTDTPGVGLINYLPPSGGVFGILFHFRTSVISRTEIIEVRYQGNVVGSPVSVIWDNNLLGANYAAAVVALKAYLEILTGATWTHDPISNPGSQIRFKTSSIGLNFADFEIDPNFQYTSDIPITAEESDIKTILEGIGFVNVVMDITNKVSEGPIRFRSGSPEKGPIAIDLELEEGYQRFERAIIDKDSFDLNGTKPPYEQYPREFKEDLSLTSNVTYSRKIVKNTWEEYYTDGIKHYDANHNLIHSTVITTEKLCCVDRIGRVFATPSNQIDTIRVYSRDLTLIGTMTRPIDWFFSALSDFFSIAVDQDSNIYVTVQQATSLFSTKIAKYNSSGIFVSLSPTLDQNIGSLVNYGTGKMILESMGNYLIFAVKEL